MEKYIINENQVGFVMKDGKFIKMIRAGKYIFSKKRGYEVHIEGVTGEVDFMGVPYEVLLRDETFRSMTVVYRIPDDAIGLLYVNGTLRSCATRKEYIFWNVYETYEIKTIPMDTPTMSGDITKLMLSIIPTKYYTKIEIQEGMVGLLAFDHIYQKLLTPGTYYYWNNKVNVTYRIVDMKLTELNIINQEILTADKIGIRINVTCEYKVSKPVELAMNITNLERQLYSYVQLAIRDFIGTYRLDEILEQKVEISNAILEKIKDKQENYFVQFVTAGIKDIILPGEIKDIMNTVLIAEKTAQANVITRREEVASTRSLLNTAKLMDDNKTLYKLKEMEYIEKICSKVKEISVSGNANLLGQLNEMLGAKGN